MRKDILKELQDMEYPSDHPELLEHIDEIEKLSKDEIIAWYKDKIKDPKKEPKKETKKVKK